MALEPLNASFYADPASLNGLKQGAATQSPQALREAARQFESLFTNMMLKSMRSATGKDPLFGSDQADFYQDMFDQQLAVQLGKGRGLGLADMLVRQLIGGTVGAPGATTATDAASGGSGANATATTSATTSGWQSKDDFISAIRPA